MDASLFFDSIARHITLNDEEKVLLNSTLHYKRLKRKQFLLAEGDVNTKSTFVISGCLRSYAIDNNGVEHVLQFAPSGWWIGDMHSMQTGEPARLNIDAIEDSEILFILKEDFNSLISRLPKFERLRRILAENAVAAYQYRQIENLTLSAIERYKKFCDTYPSLILTLPQKQVASYIGVTPEFLSKMLNKTLIK